MAIETAHQLAVTQEKLRGLEEHLQEARQKAAPGDQVAQLSLRSVARMINQMKEEIARYEATRAASASASR
jgi:cell division protein ZapA (FtsZ GTPase activity inhibitor)